MILKSALPNGGSSPPILGGSRTAEAKRAEIETPRKEGNGEGCPSRLGGLRERRELVQRGLRAQPRPKTVLVHFQLQRTHLVATNSVFLFFVTLKIMLNKLECKTI